MNFKDKMVWITGASSGIGEQLAYSVLKRGAKVILSARNVEKLNYVKKNCSSHSDRCYVVPLDLSDNKQVEKVADEVISRFGVIDILINNGGVSQRSTTMETHSDVERKIMETNFFGTVALTKKVIPVMIENGGGHIAVTSSIFGLFGLKRRTFYSASKHALHGYFESLRFELQNNNINITIVCPGWINTDISVNALKKDGSLFNKMDKGQKGGMSAQRCSEKYLVAIMKNKKIAMIGSKELMMVYLKRFVPTLFYKIAGRINVN